MPKHALDPLCFLGMLENCLALKIIEPVSDTMTSFKLPLFLIFTPELHVFLVLVASKQLQLNVNEEESHTF